MRFLNPALFAAALLAAPPSVLAWRSVLYPETGYSPGSSNLESGKVIQDFSYAGYRRGESAIPAVAGPVFNVTAAPYSADPTGAADSTAALQAAITAAGNAGGGVVFLPAGTYRLSVPAGQNQALLISKNGVVLRGAGIGLTFLLNSTTAPMRSKAVIRVQGPSSAAPEAAGSLTTALAGDILNSTASIPVASTTGFAPGDTVSVRNDITDAWITQHGEPEWLGQGASLGGLAYRRTLLAVDSIGKTLTLDAPVRYALRLRDNARVVRLSSAPLSEVGLEDFSFANLQHPGTTWAEDDYDIAGTPGYDVSGSFFIMVERSRDCWVRRLATYRPASNTSTAHLLSGGLNVRDSTHVTVEDCYFQRPQYGGGGGNGYMFRLIDSGECLVRRSEARHARHGFMVAGIGASGNVLHANLDAETGRATGATGSYATSGKSSDHHMHFTQATLVDICTAEDSWFESRYRPSGSAPRHLLTGVHSVFWNTRGTGSLAAPVVKSEQARYGYVIGTRGTRTAVELPRVAPAGTDPIDHLEGEAQGDTLVPESLFLDQRARRLGPAASFPVIPALSFPANTATITPLAFSIAGDSVSAGSLQIAWSAPAGVVLTPLDAGAVRARVPGPGDWTLTCTLAWGDYSRTQTILLRALPSAALESRSIAPFADTFIEGASAGDTNNGSVNTLRLKRASTPSTTRHALLRFQLSSLGDDLPKAARLVLTAQRAFTTYAGWSIAVRSVAASPTWTESGVTWNNAPAFGDTLATFAPSTSGQDVVDLTAAVAAARAAGATALDLALVVLAQPDTTIAYYHSREQSDPALRPRLELDVIPSAARFETWIARPSVPSLLRAAGSDPDADGVPNLLEMILARDPAAPDPASPINLDFTTGLLSFTLAAIAPADTSLQVEQSFDLMSWMPVAIPPEATGSANGGVRLVSLPLAAPVNRAFWRLRAAAE